MRIDAHQHYWKIERGDYEWITPAIPVLYRDYLPDDLQPHLDAHRLDGSIVVQAAPTLEETAYMLSLADRFESIKGIVGYLDLRDPCHLEQYRECSRHPKYVGFRIMIQEMADASAILEPDYIKAMKYYEGLEVPIDLLLRSNQLGPLTEMIKHVPRLRGVIDHIAKPRIADKEFEPWSAYMHELAGYPNLYCKLSGMVTEASHSDWKAEQLSPYIRHVLELFGPDRVMFGSDWPVCLLAAEYEQVVAVLEDALPSTWDEAARAKLYGASAAEFYRL